MASDLFDGLSYRPVGFEAELLDLLAEKLSERQEITEVPFAEYNGRPIEFTKEVLGVAQLTLDQEQILLSIRDNRETNVMAAHGVGKTWIAAIAVIYWVFAVGGLCPTTAPTQRQVNDLLWRYIRLLYDRHQIKLGGERTQLRLWSQRDTSEAWGFTASRYSEEGFAGIHDQNLFAVQDEASGIAENVDAGYRSCLAGATNRGLRIGNPLSAGTPFYYACESGSGKTFRISCFTHPNVSWAYDEDKRLKPEVAGAIKDENGRLKERRDWPDWCQIDDPYPGAVSLEWIEDTRRVYGENSGYWSARVLAQFPVDSPQSLVPRSWFEAARRRYDDDPEHWKKQAERYAPVHALDVGDGVDDHAIVSRRGPLIYYAAAYPTVGDRKDTIRAAGFLRERIDKDGGRGVVDRMGVGAGTLARLLELGINTIGTAFGSRDEIPSREREGYGDVKAYLYWKKLRREGFEEGNIVIAPLGPIEERLKDELAVTQYEYDAAGKVRIEKKDEVRKRLGRSPDVADALAMTYVSAHVVAVATSVSQGGKSGGSRWRR